ncbi:MAG: segregation/condensation protein A [Alphaproteobacteria bacterium]|nr:MAG: segregation/condensation protein A [Alphaproteobacteria bacterium]
MVSEIADFEDPRPDHGQDAAARDFVLDLEGYEGPIDVLLSLAREQKVDVTKISILALADQYLSFVSRARHLRLELAADYLVMAAWLAYLKSRLLLPAPAGDEEPSGAEMAAALKFQLQRLQAMQDAGARLMALPRLGREVFARGEPAPLRVVATTTYDVSLYELLRAYGHIRRHDESRSLRIDPSDLYSPDDALARLNRLLGTTPGWQVLASFLPPDLRGGLMWRSAVAATLAASLEMTRQGRIELRQDGPFGPIYVRPARTQPSEPS